MSRKPSAAVASAIASTPRRKPTENQLEKVRDAVRRARDIDFKMSELSEQQRALGAEKQEMLHRTLPDLFDEVGIRGIDLEAEGNMPGYDTEVRPYYHANIRDENAEAAFAWLEKEGHGDLIKTVITVELGRGERKLARAVESALKKLKVDYGRKLGVPWNTLTAFVKEQIEDHGTTPPLDLLGATVGRVVKLKERKD